MTREIERLLNAHGNTYAHTMARLEKGLDAKADFFVRKLDEILSGSNRRIVSVQWRTRVRQLMDPEPTFMQRLPRDQERVLSLMIGRDLGQPR